MGDLEIIATTAGRRAALRAAADALALLRKAVPEDQGFPTEPKACDEALDALIDGFPEDAAGQCESCDRMLIVGEKGHPCVDGVGLCANCAPSWADVKRQWDEGRDEQDDGERQDFLDAYAKHIEGGGKPEDVVLYTL